MIQQCWWDLLSSQARRSSTTGPLQVLADKVQQDLAVQRAVLAGCGRGVLGGPMVT